MGSATATGGAGLTAMKVSTASSRPPAEADPIPTRVELGFDHVGVVLGAALEGGPDLVAVDADGDVLAQADPA